MAKVGITIDTEGEDPKLLQGELSIGFKIDLKKADRFLKKLPMESISSWLAKVIRTVEEEVEDKGEKVEDQ